MEMDLLWHTKLQPDQNRSWVDLQMYYEDMTERLEKEEKQNSGNGRSDFRI
jgi:hypothetical protein